MGLEILHNPYHVPIVRSQLTRNIGVLYPEIRDEIIMAFDDVLDLRGNGEHCVPISVVIHAYMGHQNGRMFQLSAMCKR